MRAHFLRHGESVSNADRDSISLPDAEGDRLTDRGRRQVEAAAAYLEGTDAARILTSPLRRARETAELLRRRLGLEVVELEELRELRLSEGYGELSFDQQRLQRWSEWMAEHGYDPDYSHRGGESFNQIKARVEVVKERLVGDGAETIAVSHGIFLRFFFISCLLADAFPATQVGRLWQLGTVNCGLSTFEHSRDWGPQLPQIDPWRCLSWMERPWTRGRTSSAPERSPARGG